ncbi:MAG: VWA domain-containing protein [Patescibacteria group bacterium]|nr:VWA domain-containing protein [Patescibacteria group bacterium]
MRKILVGLSAVALAVATVPMFAAFEAHIINVTAKIENALTVDTTPIQYGTVFPQEKLDKFVTVALSQSFRDTTRVDDIDYAIRQKPKCGKVVADTNPVEYSDFKPSGENVEGEFICPEGYVQLPVLCPYLSKHEVTPDGTASENDSVGITAFHGSTTDWTLSSTLGTEVTGHLAKSQQDVDDQWKIDLRVPCFAGECAQDWAQFVRTESGNPNIDPNAYVQPKDNEHKLFGCDLWVEVFGVSLPGLGCKGKIDLELVLDRSGSIGSDITLLKTAANAFVTTLAPSADGTHIGESSFADTGTLDQVLTGNETDVHTAINALVSSGTTNLKEGIDLAAGDIAANGRPTIPDYMVIITDGQPNQPPDDANARAVALASATAAKAAGIQIFVVGVGSQVNPTYLKTIASGDDHYYQASDYASLDNILKQLTECPNN